MKLSSLPKNFKVFGAVDESSKYYEYRPLSKKQIPELMVGDKFLYTGKSTTTAEKKYVAELNSKTKKGLLTFRVRLNQTGSKSYTWTIDVKELNKTEFLYGVSL